MSTKLSYKLLYDVGTSRAALQKSTSLLTDASRVRPVMRNLPSLNDANVSELQSAESSVDVSDLFESEGHQGPEGPQGPSGTVVDGAPGPTGPIGPQGITGATGPPGPIGSQGIQGPTGPSGPVGDRGGDGAAGPKGHTGDTGPQGPPGDQGEGAAGPVGSTGHTGPAGQQGPEGPTGPIGMTGNVGHTGPMGYTGPTGPIGIEGPRGLKGQDGPTGPLSDLQDVEYTSDPSANEIIVYDDDNSRWTNSPLRIANVQGLQAALNDLPSGAKSSKLPFHAGAKMIVNDDTVEYAKYGATVSGVDLSMNVGNSDGESDGDVRYQTGNHMATRMTPWMPLGISFVFTYQNLSTGTIKQYINSPSTDFYWAQELFSSDTNSRITYIDSDTNSISLLNSVSDSDIRVFPETESNAFSSWGDLSGNTTFTTITSISVTGEYIQYFFRASNSPDVEGKKIMWYTAPQKINDPNELKRFLRPGHAGPITDPSYLQLGSEQSQPRVGPMLVFSAPLSFSSAYDLLTQGMNSAVTSYLT